MVISILSLTLCYFAFIFHPLGNSSTLRVSSNHFIQYCISKIPLHTFTWESYCHFKGNISKIVFTFTIMIFTSLYCHSASHPIPKPQSPLTFPFRTHTSTGSPCSYQFLLWKHDPPFPFAPLQLLHYNFRFCHLLSLSSLQLILNMSQHFTQQYRVQVFYNLIRSFSKIEPNLVFQGVYHFSHMFSTLYWLFLPNTLIFSSPLLLFPFILSQVLSTPLSYPHR